jgi:hypothetical protein
MMAHGNDGSEIMTQATLMWILSPVSALIAAYAWFAERRYRARKDLDKVSMVNWTLVQYLGTLMAVVCFAVAIKLK